MPLDTLDRNTTLITVNQRLSRVLRAQFDRTRLARGERVWESPDILPYAAWIRRCWQDYIAVADGPVPSLLEPEQDLTLWQGVVAEDASAADGPALIRGVDTAHNAQAAWALLRDFDLEFERLPASASAEVRAFRDWARAYDRRCRDAHRVDAASAALLLARHAAPAIAASGVERILLAGFERLTPRQQSMFDGLGAHGVSVQPWQPPKHASRARRVAFPEQDDELECAARWARRCVEDGAAGPVGIVVPDLAAVRHRVEAIFEDVFTPGANRPGAVEPARAFNVSLGAPLAELPVVSDALLAMRAMTGRISLRDAGRWLLSPYLGGGEPYLRARLDAELRRIGEPYYTLARLAELAARVVERAGAGTGTGGDTAIGTLLIALERRTSAAARPYPLSEWATRFSSWLLDAGWPGARTLTSEEYQAVRAFRELLASFAALGPLAAPSDHTAALTRLHEMAERQLFQPRSETVAVQILGVLEAVGVDYSHLWLSGLHHQAWPEPARPNPFLPITWQRAHRMPRADSAQQLAFAQNWSERMLSSAPEVIVSHPLQQGDEALRASALVTHVPCADAESVAAYTGRLDLHQVHADAPALEQLEDSLAPAADFESAVRGGVAIIKDQAACPFRAFAVHRLGAVDVAAPDSSLDPRVRGNLVHRLLERLWQTLEGQAQLLALGGDERMRIVRTSVERVLADEARQRPQTLRGRLLALEQERLEALAHAWLAIEAERSPFRVEAELDRSASIAGLPLTLRPDRADRLEDGRIFLVDYKTGRSEPGDWFGERPEEPQLPLYALAMDDAGSGAIAGLAFGVLRPGVLGYRGLGADGDLAPGVDAVDASRIRGAREAADWDAHMALWRARLERLAEAFLSGDARVDPKSPPATCRYCGLQPLCRIHDQ